MIYVATTIADQKVDLSNAFNVQINKSRETPADSLSAIFICNEKQPEYKFIDVYTDQNQLFFSGIIDEQKFEISKNGCFLTLKSRSKAAYLIDNEASPQIYRRPSLDVIFNRHIKPYGFLSVNGTNSSFYNTIEVEKGMSEWDVFELFCVSCLNIIPIVNPDGTIDVTNDNSFREIIFSNLNNGINYNFISQKYNRYKLISEIIVCAPYAAIYVDKIIDQTLIEKDIKRRKFISMTEDTSLNKNISVNTAETLISDSKKKFNEVIINCPGAIGAQIGNSCTVYDSILGTIKNLNIYEIDYVLNQDAEFTEFTLLEG